MCVGKEMESEEANFSEKQKSKFHNKSVALLWGGVLTEFIINQHL